MLLTIATLAGLVLLALLLILFAKWAGTRLAEHDMRKAGWENVETQRIWPWGGPRQNH